MSIKPGNLLYSNLYKFLFSLSAAAYAAIVAVWWIAVVIGSGNITKITTAVIIAAAYVLIVFVLTLFLEYKFCFLEKQLAEVSKVHALISLLIALYLILNVALESYTCINNTLHAAVSNNGGLAVLQTSSIMSESMLTVLLCSIYIIAGIVASFSVFTVIYIIINRLHVQNILKLWKGMDKAEQIIFAAAVIVFSCLITYVYTTTSFSYAYGDIVFQMDSDFTADHMFSFRYIGNVDERYFFFSFAGLPVTFIASLFSDIFFFTSFPVFYYVISLCTAVLISAGGILLSRMVEAGGISKVFFLTGYYLTYPVLVFAIIIDKYVLSTFYVILLLFLCIYNLRGRFAVGLAAAGTLTTSAFFIPYLAYDKNRRIWAANIFRYILAFIIIAAFCSGIYVLYQIFNGLLPRLNAYAGPAVSWSEKARQYINLVSSCFIEPATVIKTPIPNLTAADLLWQYELAQPESVNPCGVVFLIFASAGFILNRNSRFAQLALSWVLYSFIILFIFGWQSSRNEMFLVSLYFGWAFFSLVFMFFEKIFNLLPAGSKVVNYIVYTAAVLLMAVINIRGIYSLISFGIEYYPV